MVTEGVLIIVLKHAEENQAGKVLSVQLQAGELRDLFNADARRGNLICHGCGSAKDRSKWYGNFSGASIDDHANQ